MIIPFLRSKQAPHLRVGIRGEHCAVRYLRKGGYVIHERNVRIGRDEIDIVAWDPRDHLFVFVEVKTRMRSDPDYIPELNITHAKRSHMRRAADHWVNDRKYEGGWRLDVICVVGDSVISHIEGLE